jgi:hypothetical protein
MTFDTPWTNGACHCGTVRFQVRLIDGPDSARRCTCSYCRMRGAVVVSANLANFRVLAGEEHLSAYQFHTMTATHWFCSKCGIYTHHQRRSDPTLFGINAACLEGVSPFDFEDVAVYDGVNHPSDTGAKPRIAGHLRFIPVR